VRSELKSCIPLERLQPRDRRRGSFLVPGGNRQMQAYVHVRLLLVGLGGSERSGAGERDDPQFAQHRQNLYPAAAPITLPDGALLSAYRLSRCRYSSENISQALGL